MVGDGVGGGGGGCRSNLSLPVSNKTRIKSEAIKAKFGCVENFSLLV